MVTDGRTDQTGHAAVVSTPLYATAYASNLTFDPYSAHITLSFRPGAPVALDPEEPAQKQLDNWPQKQPEKQPQKQPERRPAAMGLTYNVYLSSTRIYGCKTCKTHLANHDDIISRNFRGQHGKAYLFDSVVNVSESEPAERNMTTGKHIVRDISCRQCKETVGWKYDKAYENSEKYKEGKFILEAELLCTVA